MLRPGALLAPRLTSPDGDRDIILAAFTRRVTPHRCAIGYVAEGEVATVGLAPTGLHSLQTARPTCSPEGCDNRRCPEHRARTGTVLMLNGAPQPWLTKATKNTSAFEKIHPIPAVDGPAAHTR